MAIAFFITFTTYRSWLHGTGKGEGSVDRGHNQFGGDFVVADPDRLDDARDAMAEPPYRLDAARRAVVRDAVVALSREKRWRLSAVHVRSNHVHVVVSADRDPGRLMSDIKGRASRELTRAGFESADRNRWTRHGSTLHLFTPSEVRRKVTYTLDEQGEAMAVYDGRET